jgi:hypothetical protein
MGPGRYGFNLAFPEKALLDTIYLRKSIPFPSHEFPKGFNFVERIVFFQIGCDIPYSGIQAEMRACGISNANFHLPSPDKEQRIYFQWSSM